MLLRKVLLSIMMVLLFSMSAKAVNPDEILTDPVLEARARSLSKEVRCMVCQNQSIDNSDASVAKDLRLLIRDRIVAGDSDTQVLDYLVGRFGEFVLLKPRFSMSNIVLWATPIFALVLGVFLVIAILSKSKKQNNSPNRQKGDGKSSNTNGESLLLSKKEKDKITKILGESD